MQNDHLKKLSIIELLNWLYDVRTKYSIDNDSTFIVESIKYKNIELPVFISSNEFYLGWISMFYKKTDLIETNILPLNYIISYCKSILKNL